MYLHSAFDGFSCVFPRSVISLHYLHSYLWCLHTYIPSETFLGFIPNMHKYTLNLHALTLIGIPLFIIIVPVLMYSGFLYLYLHLSQIMALSPFVMRTKF